ncbi:MAG: cytochrome P450 [Ornithinibacter sp.]
MSAAGRLPLPPGRLGMPWLGETLAILRSNHGFHRDRVARYGPIYKTRILGSTFVVFSGHEAFHTFATDPRIRRGDADALPTRQIFRGSVALYDGGDQAARKGVMLAGLWEREAIGAYLGRMQHLMERSIEDWARRARVTLRPELELWSDRLAGAIITGDTSEEHAAELHQVITDMQGAFMAPPFPIPGTTYGRAIKGRNRLGVIVQGAIQRHRTGEWDDVTSRMLDAARAAGIPEESVAADIRHLMFTAQPGYSVPLLLATLALAEHPEVRERARAEVLDVAPYGPITMEQVDALSYLLQVSKELRRYYAMNATTFFGRVQEDLEVGGFRIPAGWSAMGAVHMTLHNPAEFPEPDRFDPDRFTLEREATFPPGRYVPHGDGPPTAHRCAGEDIVTVTIQVYLAVLLRSVTWSLPEQDLGMTNEVFPVPTSGLVVDVRPVGREDDD